MHKIIFFKYTANGNNFILVDETENTQIPLSQISSLSKEIENPATGIGCDSLIILQNYDKEINPLPTFTMRIYENGLESNMCGNGLACIGQHLLNKHSVTSALVATEIPSGKHQLRNVSSLNSNSFKVSLGKATLPPDRFLKKNAVSVKTKNKIAYLLKTISIKININDQTETIKLDRCYITYTGEPHIVIFRPSTIQYQSNTIEDIFSIIFNPSLTPENLLLSKSIINQIGLQLNEMTEYFPKGVNVNFSEILPNGTIANRCYERGINDETYSCGTGATAVSVMANELSLIDNPETQIIPWRARYQAPYQHAKLTISRDHNNYSLTTETLFIAQGEYHYTGRNI